MALQACTQTQTHTCRKTDRHTNTQTHTHTHLCTQRHTHAHTIMHMNVSDHKPSLLYLFISVIEAGGNQIT